MNLSFIKAIVWAMLIFIGSAISGDTFDGIKLINIPGFDKVVHFTWYFFLFLFTTAGVYKLKGKISPFYLVLILFICVVYGGLLEFLQGNVFIKRSEDLYDFIANSSGAAIGSIFFSNIYKSRFWKKWL